MPQKNIVVAAAWTRRRCHLNFSTNTHHTYAAMNDPCVVTFVSRGPRAHAAAKITNADFSNAGAVQSLVDAWFTTPACHALTARLVRKSLAPVEPRPKLSWSSNLRQVRVLVVRMILNGVRDPAAYSLRWARTDTNLRRNSWQLESQT